MFFPIFDPSMIIVIPGLILAMYAQFKVKSTFAHYSQVLSQNGMTGARVAKAILEKMGVGDVEVEMVEGTLTDHYDPKGKVLRLSKQVYNGNSLASLGVAAHEAGHAIQHANGYLPLNIRHALVPVANFGSTLAFPLFLIGLFMSSTGLITAGLYMFSAVVLFQIVTLPVEFNASSLAMTALESDGYISGDEIKQTKAVLDAAALTYVAAALVGLLTLLRLIVLSGILRRDD